MSTWHFEPWAHADIGEISKDLTHQLPNLSSHVLKASVFLLQQVYLNALPVRSCPKPAPACSAGRIPKTELLPWPSGPEPAAGHTVVPERSPHSGAKTWPQLLCAHLCLLLWPLGGKPLNPPSSSCSLLKREMQTDNQDTLKYGNCKFKYLFQPIKQRLLISVDSLKLGVSSSMSDFSVAWNWAPSSPQLFRAAKAVQAGNLGLATQLNSCTLKTRNSNARWQFVFSTQSPKLPDCAGTLSHIKTNYLIRSRPQKYVRYWHVVITCRSCMWTRPYRIQQHGPDGTAQLSEMHRETGVWLRPSTYLPTSKSQDLNTKQLPSLSKAPLKK